MPIGVNRYPIQESPFDISGSMAKGIAMKLAQLQQQKLEKELPYAADTARANIASKMGFGLMAGPQQLTKILTSPAFKSYPKEVQEAIQKAATQIPLIQSYMTGLMAEGLPGNAPQQQQGDSNLLQSILGYFGIGADEGQQPGAPAPQPKLNAEGMPIPFSSQGAPAPQRGRTTINLPDDSVYEGDTPVGRMAKAESEIEGAKETAKKEADVQVKRMDELRQQAQDESAFNQQLDNKLDQFHNLYEKASMTGPFTPDVLKNLDDYASQLDQLSSDMQVTMANQLFGGNATDAKEQLAGNLKLNSKMTKAAEAGAYDRLKAAGERAKHKGKFVELAKDAGAKDAQKIKQYWYDLNNDIPFYDNKELKPLTENNEILTDDFITNFVKEKMKPASKQAKGKAKGKYSIGERILAKSIQMPEFNSQQEAMDWYNSQPEFTKKAIRASLERKK